MLYICLIALGFQQIGGGGYRGPLDDVFIRVLNPLRMHHAWQSTTVASIEVGHTVTFIYECTENDESISTSSTYRTW